MRSWNLEAPPENGSRGPRELFSTPLTRLHLIDLARNEELGFPGDSGRVVIQVLSGGVELAFGDDSTTFDAGTLLALEPGEAHSVRALEQSRFLAHVRSPTGAARPLPRVRVRASRSSRASGSISLSRLLACEARGSQA